MADLFLSYARADSRDFVARLASALEARGKDAWVDLDDIPPASTWHEDLRAGIAASDSFCYVISPGSVTSSHCQVELEHAVALNKRIIPVLLLPVPDGEVPEAVASRNWVPQTGRFTDDFESSLGTLIEALETDLDWVREHTRWGQRAAEWERRGEDRSLLARGSDLDQAETFLGGAAGREPQPTDVMGRFVLASRRAATRRQRQLVGGVSVALVITLVLAVLALLQRNTAVEQRQEAEAQRREAEAQRAAATSRALAANAFLNLPTDPELSLLLGLEAAKASPTTEAENALRSAILESRVRRQLHQEGSITAASYSPDGRRIVTIADGGPAVLWDAATGEQVAELTGHSPHAVQWSADGSRVVTVASDYTARVYDATSGAPVSVATDPDEYRLTDVAISSDGSFLVTSAFVNGQVHFWSAADGSLLGTVPRSTVDNVALSPDDSLLLLAVQGEAVELWNSFDGRLVQSFPEDAQDFYTDVAFSPDGSTFATAGADGFVRVRRVAGTFVTDIEHNASVESVAFSPDGQLLATASEDGTAQVTDLAEGEVVATFTRHAGSVESIAFSPRGDLVATGGNDGVVQLWRPQGGAGVASLVGHAAPVNQVSFSPSGNEVVTASDDSTARVWTTAGAMDAFPERSATEVPETFGAAMSADGHYVAMAQFTGDASTHEDVLDVETGRVVGTFALVEGEQWVPAVSPDGTLAVTKEYGGPTRLRNTSDGSLVTELPLTGAYDAAFDPDGRRVLVVGEAGGAGVYDTRTGELMAGLEGHDPTVEVLGAGFSPDGKRALTASVDGTARVWDAVTGRQLLDVPAIGPTVRQYQQAASVVLSPDGRVLVTAAGWEDDARLWDAETGEPLATLEGAKEGGVTDASFSADGRFLVTSTATGKVRLWDGRTGRPLTTVSDRVTSPDATGFVGDGHRIAMLGETDDQTTVLVADCTVCDDLGSLVELGRTRVTRDLTDTEKANYLGAE